MVPNTHDLVHAATVHTAGQVAHVLYEETKEHGIRRKLLVVDNLILPGNDFSPGKFLDLQMLIFPSGCERTEKQFHEIFTAAGWKLNRVIPTRVPESIVEGIPA